MRVLVLVGPKGCGKTTLGRFAAEHAGVHFVEVEAISRRVLHERGGVIDEPYAAAVFAAIGLHIVQLDHAVICIETTGASEHAERFIERLRAVHDVRLIRVHARAETCARRITRRDPSRQVDVPVDLIEQMHRRTEELTWPWDLEVVNDPPLAAAALVARLAPLLADR